MTAAITRPRTLLRAALGIDATVTGLNGLAYVAAASVLEPLLGVPAGQLRFAGAFLLVFTAAVAFLASRREPPRAGVAAIVAINVAWVIGSIAVLAVGGFPLVGEVWIVLQALVVAAFAAVQGYALRVR